MKKRLAIYGTLTIACLGVFGYLWLYPGVTILSYCRIHPGMHATQVEELLGGPHGPVWRSGLPIRVPNQGFVEYWRGLTGSITIFYDTDARVVTQEWDWNERILPDLFGPQVRE